MIARLNLQRIESSVSFASACRWHFPVVSARLAFGWPGCGVAAHRMLPQAELLDMRDALWRLELTMISMAAVALEAGSLI